MYDESQLSALLSQLPSSSSSSSPSQVASQTHHTEMITLASQWSRPLPLALTLSWSIPSLPPPPPPPPSQGACFPKHTWHERRFILHFRLPQSHQWWYLFGNSGTGTQTHTSLGRWIPTMGLSLFFFPPLQKAKSSVQKSNGSLKLDKKSGAALLLETIWNPPTNTENCSKKHTHTQHNELT